MPDSNLRFKAQTSDPRAQPKTKTKTQVLRLIAATLQFNKMSLEEGFAEFDSDADG